MRDQVFTGRDVADAVTAASRALGVGETALKYIVLERETPGGVGRSPTPARIAILLDARPPARPEARPPSPTGDVRSRLQAIVRAVAEAADLDVITRVEESEEAVVLRIEGVDRGFFHDPALHQSIEHLLARMFAPALAPKRLALECEGFRASRDAALVSIARELVAAVRSDGQPRQTRPLNSYERRIIHVAVGEETGVRSFSVGEGADRRVTIALVSAPSEPAEG